MRSQRANTYFKSHLVIPFAGTAMGYGRSTLFMCYLYQQLGYQGTSQCSCQGILPFIGSVRL